MLVAIFDGSGDGATVGFYWEGRDGDLREAGWPPWCPLWGVSEAMLRARGVKVVRA